MPGLAQLPGLCRARSWRKLARSGKRGEESKTSLVAHFQWSNYRLLPSKKASAAINC